MTHHDQAARLRKGTEASSILPVSPLRCLAIASGKGGVGKTMVSVGVAYALAAKGAEVLLLDADLGLANVDLQMGLDPVFTLQDVIYGTRNLDDIVVKSEKGPDVIAASSGSREMVEMSGARRDMMVEDLMRFSRNYEYLIIDVAAGIGQEVTSYLRCVPEVLVVVTNEPTSLMGAYSLIKILHQSEDAPAISLVINMVRDPDEGDRLAARLNTITKRFLDCVIPVSGVILRDDAVVDAIRARTPIGRYAPKSAPAQCLIELAHEVSSHDARIRISKKAHESMFEKLAGYEVPSGSRTNEDG